VAAVSLACARAEDLQVLLVEGASNHDWEHRIEILESLLSKNPDFELSVEIAPSDQSDPAWSAWSPDFGAYDVVISGYRSGPDADPWPPAVQAAFESYVANGGGFYCFHEANQSFPGWAAYQEMIGLGWGDGQSGCAPALDEDGTPEWFGPGEGGFTGHGDRDDVLVRKRGDHPIHAGFPTEWMVADIEVVRFPRNPAPTPEQVQGLEVIAHALDPDPDGIARRWPVEWVVEYGAGRVYGSTYGHLWEDQQQPEGMRCAVFQETLIRALRWCAGEAVDPTLPIDFPGLLEPTIRPHTEGLAGFGGPDAVAPFNNGLLPTSSLIPSGIEVVPAFPALAWDSPIDAHVWPGGSAELLVAEMDGRFFRVDDSDFATSREQVLDLRDRAWYMNWNAGDPQTKHGGVMSCAFHPRFGLGEGSDFLFVFYLHHPLGDPDAPPPFYQRLSRFEWSDSSQTFDPASERILIQQYDTVKGHEGGGIAFGGDGFLYLALGDEGTNASGATAHSQTIDDRARSGVWRIDVDEQGPPVSHPIRRQPQRAHPSHESFTQHYFIPEDNPWNDTGGAVLEEFYALGLREPHRMSYDAVEDCFWIGDVGAGKMEEVNRMDQAGLNFQWNYLEGTSEGYRDPPQPILGIETPPVHEYDHSVGNCIIGGHVYRGQDLPELQGKYVFGDNGNQQLFTLSWDDSGNSSVELLGQARPGIIWSGISSFAVDSRGELLVLQMGAGQPGGGQVGRIRPAGSSSVEEWQYPEFLSGTGLFTDLATLDPTPGLIPYEVNAPLWSDGMSKRRWVMIPNDGVPSEPDERLGYDPLGAWEFPVGTVFVKHFERPDDGRFIETRVMVHGSDGWGGVTYRWLPDGSDAERLEDGAIEPMTLDGEGFDYAYPSRLQCLQCHAESTGSVLGFRSHQLDRDALYPNGREAHQLESFSAAGLLDAVLKEEDFDDTLRAVDLDDAAATPELRIRSYLDSNCAHCHQPGGSSRAFFDARLGTPLTNQSLVCGPVIEDLGLPAPAVVKPGSLENSSLFQRLNSIDECCRMPPIGKGRVHLDAVTQIADWILGMRADSCSGAQSFFAGGTLGNAAPTGLAGADSGVFGRIVVLEELAYLNDSGRPLRLSLDRIRYEALGEGTPLTPFAARVEGPGDFTVLAVGDTREGHSIGPNQASFADSDASVLLAPGEALAAGFLEARADGSGATVNSLVRWSAGGATSWVGGASTPAATGSVVVDLPPDPGDLGSWSSTRDYAFSLDFTVTAMRLGNEPPDGAFLQVDGAASNVAINLSDAFTNASEEPMTISIDRFRFHASRVANPLTPFVVRVDGAGDDAADFQVLAIGATRSEFELGLNEVPFAAGGTLVRLEPGETLAPGFIDSFPDGSGGSVEGSLSFVGGGDTIFYRYRTSSHPDGDRVGSLALGQPPAVSGWTFSPPERSYLFSIELGFGGPPDLDVDGLPDAWEEVYAGDLALLSATGDLDGDGLTDLEESLAGTDPTDETSGLRALDIRLDPANGEPVVEFTSRPGRRYEVMGSRDLLGWQSLGTVEAESWPAESTSALVPETAQPGGDPGRLFLKVKFPPDEGE